MNAGETMKPLRRRDLLGLAGSVAAISFAGCLDDAEPDTDQHDDDRSDDGDEDDENGDDDGSELDDVGSLPAYADWLPTDDALDETWFTYIDWKTFRELDDSELFDEDADPNGDADPYDEGFGGSELDDDEEDPLLFLPMFGLFMGTFGIGLTVGMAGLGGLLDFDDEDEDTDDSLDDDPFDEPLESSADEWLIAGSTIVLLGAIDRDEIGDQLSTTGFEEDGEIDGYDIYVRDEMLEQTVAVGDGAVLLPADDGDEDEIEAFASTKRGDRERLSDAVGEMDWALRAAGEGTTAIGTYGDDLEADSGLSEPGLGDDPLEDDSEPSDPDIEDDPLTGLTASVSAATFEADTVTASLSAAGDDASFDEDEIADVYGHTADEQTVNAEDDRVIITGTWEESGN